MNTYIFRPLKVVKLLLETMLKTYECRAIWILGHQITIFRAMILIFSLKYAIILINYLLHHHWIEIFEPSSVDNP